MDNFNFDEEDSIGRELNQQIFIELCSRADGKNDLFKHYDEKFDNWGPIIQQLSLFYPVAAKKINIFEVLMGLIDVVPVPAYNYIYSQDFMTYIASASTAISTSFLFYLIGLDVCIDTFEKRAGLTEEEVPS